MSELQTLKTAIHEIAHAKLHAIDPEAPVTEQADRPDSRTREVQAESVAYAVCQHYGLDTSDYSFGYVAGWSSGKDLKELRASLETIRATAHELITAIDGHLAELQQQRQAQQAVEQAAEQPAPDSVFSKLPPEQQQEMTDSVKAMLQTLIDADVKSTGEVTQGTLDAIQTQGFVLSGDGTLQRAEAQEAAYRLESGNILFICGRKSRSRRSRKSTSDSSLQRSESTPICSSLTLPFSGSLWIKFMSPRFTRRTRTSHALRSEKLRSSTTSLVHLILRKQGINPKQPKRKENRRSLNYADSLT